MTHARLSIIRVWRVYEGFAVENIEQALFYSHIWTEVRHFDSESSIFKITTFDMISAVAGRNCGSEASHVGPDYLGLFHRKRHLHIF